MITDNKNKQDDKDSEIAPEDVAPELEIDDPIEEVSEVETGELENLENQLKRALADYQNLERRITEEKGAWIRSANKDLILKLLPVLDNLFLAQKHISDEGLKLSVKKFLDALSDEGVERIETKDKMFDPNTMECVSVQEGEENKVIEEVRPGFMLDEIVLRPAQVLVGGQIKN